MAPERIRAGLAGVLLCALLASAPARAVLAPPKDEAALDAMADEGRVAEAIAALEIYVKAHPQHDPQRFLLARAYMENGEVEKAGAQYQYIVQTSAFPVSREKAKAELAKMDELPTIPVGDPTPSRQAHAGAQEFPVEKTALVAETFAGGGYDTNASSGSSVDRYFFFDLLQEHQDSASYYGTVGGSVAGAYAFNDGLSWRSAIGGGARDNGRAHFADTQDLSAQTQVRWSGAQQRLTAGFVYSESWYGDDELNHAIAFTSSLEVLTRALLLTLNGEAARLRFPGAPLRDADSFVLRANAVPAPDPAAKWLPSLTAFTGFEEETHDDSPFGRSLWGLSGGLTRRLPRGFSIEGSVGYTKSMFDGNFTSPERRSDDHKEIGLFGHWHPDEKSRWIHSLGARYLRNDSSEPLYDFERATVGYELSATWGGRD